MTRIISQMPGASLCNRALRFRAFTLFELLIVMGIIISLVTAFAPTFAGILQSNRRASAINMLTGTLSRARSVAIERNKVTGVVFLFDIATKKTTLIVVQLHSAANGSLIEPLGGVSVPTKSNQGFVFVPAENIAPVELPQSMLVYSLLFHHDIADVGVKADNWYFLDKEDTPYYSPYYNEIFLHPDRGTWFVKPWFLPRNDPRLFISVRDNLDPKFFKSPADVKLDKYWTLIDPSRTVDGINMSEEEVHESILNAHSFVIIFGKDGVLKPITDTGTNSSVVEYYLEFPNLPIDSEPSTGPLALDPYDKNDIKDLQTNFNPTYINQSYLSINTPSPNPEVMLRPADMLAIVDLNDLVKRTGIDEPWGLHSAGSFAPWPEFRGTAEASINPLNPTDVALDRLMLEVSDWIDLNASIITFDPNSGIPQKRSPSQ